MKRKIAVIIAVVLTVAMMTGTVAYAANGNGIDNAISKAQERLDFLNKIKPLLDDIAANRDQIASLRTQLKEQRQLAKAHIAELKSNVSTITDEQIQAIQSIKAQIKEARAALKATNATMVQARQAMRAARKAMNYDDFLTASNSVINLQNTRIEQLNKLIDLNKQIQAV
jgi:hypothetical protein